MNAMSQIMRELPSNIEAEQALLGAVLINNDAFHVTMSSIDKSDFYIPEHGLIWDIIKKQIDEGRSANPITMKPFLDGLMVNEMTAYQYTVRLSMEAVSVINAKEFAMAIKDASTRRRLISLTEEIKERAYNSSPDDTIKNVLSDFENDLDKMVEDLPTSTATGTSASAVDRLLKLYESKEQAPTIKPPLPEVSEVLSGDFEAGNLYGLLSASGEGKTSLALQIMDYAAQNGHPVFFLSYDQSAEQCFMQIACQRIGIDRKRIHNQALTQAEHEKYAQELMKIRKLPFEVKNCGSETIFQIKGHVKRFLKWNKSDKTPLIVLDHVRKVTPSEKGMYEGRIASEIGGVCKALAKEYGLVWLNIQQRKSMKEGRDNPQPFDGDLFGGEQAKEDYDAILYLYRPDKYKDARLSKAMPEKKRDQLVSFHERWSGLSKLGSLKVRFGDPSIYKALKFEGQFTRYSSTYAQPDPQLF